MRILFIAMSESIHTARWINQLHGLGWDFHLYPSCSVEIHRALRDISIHQQSLPFFCPRDLDPSVRVVGAVWPIPSRISYGLFCRLWPARVADATRLAALIDELRPDVVHSIELQHAGYLTSAARELVQKPFPPWMVTNYGSDTFYFGRQEDHKARLHRLLSACDFYKCECERDVSAGRSLGFRGHVLPVTPNTGGFDLEHLAHFRSPGPTSRRRLVMVKGYHGWAGRALHALEAIRRSARCLCGLEVVVYSADRQVAKAAAALARETGIAVRILPQTDHATMLRLHGQARMSIGVSITDGVSTSFLEALAMGSFPIQTCTACVDEWIEHGTSGFIVQPDDIEGIADAIRIAATDDLLVDRAAERNWITAQERLGYDLLRDQAIAMYRRAADHNVRN